MSELVHDTVTLAELQVRLLKVELQSWSRGMAALSVWLLAALLLAAGTIPVLLLSLAQALVELAGLSEALALSGAALVGLAAAGIAAAVGRSKLRKHRSMLSRSQEEFRRNITWLRQVLKES